MSDEKAFRDELSSVLEPLAAEQRRCPPDDHLLRLAEGTLDGARRDELERHVELCPLCSDLLAVARQPPAEIDDITWHRVAERLDRRILPSLTSPHRASRQPGWLALAAVVFLAVAGGWWWQVRDRSAPPPAEVRGSQISVVAPMGAVDRLDSFRWTAPLPIELVYTVLLERDGEAIWRGETTATTIAVEAGVIVPAENYRWRVEARPAGATGGDPLASSSWIEVRVAASER